jgi:periplasmic divalent cation tolerance protein
MKTSTYVVGFVTCASKVEARQLARAVLDRKLAACVNILSGAESHYWWRGKLECSKECLLLIKTTNNKTGDVMKVIKANHSYEVPEIIFAPIVAGDRNYLKWLRGAVAAVAILAAGVARANNVDALIQHLSSTNDEVRAVAASRLATVGGERVEKKFRQMLKAGGPEARQMAVVGLLQVSDAPEDLELVRGRLKDKSSTVRWSAVVALGQSGRQEAIPWLEDVAKNDASGDVKEAAAEAVKRLQNSIAWQRTLPAGLTEAKALKKPVLVYCFVRGAKYCEEFEDGLLRNREVVDAAQEFVCVRLDAGRHGDQLRKFDVRGAPTLLVLDAQGNEMNRVAGLVEKEKLLAKLGETRRGKLSFREARRLAGQDKADVAANWKVAETYLEEGREELARPYLQNVVAADAENQRGYTDNALFALGFSLGRRGQYAQSVVCLEHLLAKWPGFKDKDKALYCLGLSELAIGQKEKGRASLEQLVREFPNSSATGSAKKALEKLEGKK